MTEHMSLEEYRRTVAEPALNDGAMSDEDFKKALRVAKPNKKEHFIATHVRVGALVFEGKNKVSEEVGDWIPVKKPRKNEEDDLTKQVADYLEVLQQRGRVLAYSHIPNSTFTNSWPVKNRNKAMGVRPGVPDMLIVFPGSVLFLELKKESGGTLSPYQKVWIEALNNTGKVTAVVAAGLKEAVAAINKQLD